MNTTTAESHVIPAMPYEFTITKRVEFSDTDMAGIMHFSNYFRFMEAAEHAFFRSFGGSVVARDGERHIGFPRIHAECRYRRPARFEDVLTVRLIVRDITAKRIRYDFLFYPQNATDGRPTARGEVEVACVEHLQDGSLASIDIPQDIARHLEKAPPSILDSLEQVGV